MLDWTTCNGSRTAPRQSQRRLGPRDSRAGFCSLVESRRRAGLITVLVEIGDFSRQAVPERMQRDHMFDIIRNVATRLMKDANLPALQRQASDQRMGRQVPTEALTYYSRGLLYADHGQRDKAIEMFNQATTIFPGYAEAEQALQRVKSS